MRALAVLVLGLSPLELPRTTRMANAAALAPCRLLSLSGGGSWGAFEAGVISRLLEERGEAFDYARILGVSAGSLNAGLLATEPPGHSGLRAGAATLRKLWTEARTRDVWEWHIFRPDDHAGKSLLSTAPLRRLLERVLTGRSIRRNVTFGLTSVATGRPAVVDEREIARAGGKAMVPLMLASSAIPVLFPPIWYNETLWIDGGVASNVLTVHGVDLCPAGAPVELDIVNCLPLLAQLSAAQEHGLGLIDMAMRSVQVLLQTAFEHQLNFKCAPGERSNVLARVFSPRESMVSSRSHGCRVAPTRRTAGHSPLLSAVARVSGAGGANSPRL